MEQNNPEKRSLKETILGKIKHGDVKMKPKAYFVLQAALVVLAIALTVLLAVAVFSFLIFALRASGRIFLPQFGTYGLWLFLARFPWAVLLLIAALVALLEILVARFSYKRPFVYSLGGIVLLVVLAGMIVDRTPLHSALIDRARQNHLPLAGKIYQSFDNEQVEEIFRGTASDITDDGFTLNSSRGQFQVKPDPGVSVNGLYDGDQVFVMGQEAGREIHAFGIRKAGPGPFFRGMMHRMK